jgi:hypothetical protein
MIAALYLGTLALHAVFVGYVVAGTAYVLVARDSFAELVRGRLPFMLGCGITAGVAPLLFIQLLYQRRFYTANLLLGPRWLAVVPVLIAGFYALYLAKQSDRWKKLALAGALACFVFVAYSWTELHELMQADAAWRDFYAAGERIFVDGDIVPRMLVWLGGMATLFAAVSAWSREAPVRRLAVIALAGRAVSIAGGAWLVHRGFAVDAAWGWLLVAAIAVDAVGWLAAWRRPDGPGLLVATAGGAGALIAAVCVREAPRLALVEPARGDPGGAVVFAIAFALGIGAMAWVVRTVRAADGS